MDMIYVFTVILQSMVISLGVGSSTIAIINFFVAIADGTIDPQERAMMGIVYKVLRVAMVFILLTAIIILVISLIGNATYWSSYVFAFWTLVIMLYANAIMMTKHIIPSNIGPALQASTWYTLGILMSLTTLGLTTFSYFEFIVGYLAAVALGVSIVNVIMAVLKRRRSTPQA